MCITVARRNIHWLRNDIAELRDELEYEHTDEERAEIAEKIEVKQDEIGKLEAAIEDLLHAQRKGEL